HVHQEFRQPVPRLGHGAAQWLQPGAAAAQPTVWPVLPAGHPSDRPQPGRRALLGALTGLLTAQRRGYDRADRQAGLYSYNGVLIGILISAVLPWSAILPPLIIAAGG